ncbi:MAG: NAD-dependent epimerase/dehydratase family protein [Boseongicola sp.]|nr:MAG: NAD-dependent epimerase/dehydratase family protein [Boseongicola sp.]
MRIFFTGGAGKAGRHAVKYLLDQGHRVMSVDLKPCDVPGADNRIVDLTDAGQVYDAMTSLADFDELFAGNGVPKFDAVVHFAAVPRIMIVPDNECFRINTISTYNVIDAAVKLGIPKVVFASSETTYGIAFANGERKPDYLPIDENHSTEPEDSYALSKVANEATGRAFQRRSGIDIYGLRINNVIEPHEYEQDFPGYFANPHQRRPSIFSYIDARDLGQMVDKCLATDGLGYQVFNVSNDEHSVTESTGDLLRDYYQDVSVTRELGETETFFSNQKAKDLLGFAPQHSWRDVLDG